MGNDAKRGLLCPEGPGQAEGKSSVSTGDRAHKIRHAGTSAMDCRTPPGKKPSPGWPGAPLYLPGSTPAPQFEAGCSHLHIRAWTHAGVRTLKRCPNLSQGSSPFPGLCHGAPQPWAPPHQYHRGSSPRLLRVWLPLAAKGLGAEAELLPILWHSRHSPSPANQPRAPA